jgi:hypothetical protein
MLMAKPKDENRRTQIDIPVGTWCIEEWWPSGGPKKIRRDGGDTLDVPEGAILKGSGDDIQWPEDVWI